MGEWGRMQTRSSWVPLPPLRRLLCCLKPAEKWDLHNFHNILLVHISNHKKESLFPILLIKTWTNTVDQGPVSNVFKKIVQMFVHFYPLSVLTVCNLPRKPQHTCASLHSSAHPAGTSKEGIICQPSSKRPVEEILKFPAPQEILTPGNGKCALQRSARCASAYVLVSSIGNSFCQLMNSLLWLKLKIATGLPSYTWMLNQLHANLKLKLGFILLWSENEAEYSPQKTWCLGEK